ncbi:MAG: DEAD/DEAH box helicase [Methanomassiliicoccaceae archaeon]|jgi:ATP-dependent RNA helicase DeaD|nr:DEAD/DEAH box helicase [Methanomassiliicoccaceae archaeon]HQA21982.1 DEAD/DEAH box helicase [Methanomassiliicoccaceae archaeon]HQD88726.1 DEAD/DEAH box helicase [Methanomassiliicoccaceae archaeon]
MGFEEPTPVQVETIPLLLKGRDVIAQAQTGTGKTAAFGIPIVQAIERQGKAPSALILCPTRELAVQVSEEINRLAMFKDLNTLAIYGGASIENQIEALRRGVDIVAGTPGRVIDHIHRGTIDLASVRFMVLDEADRMLDMGFIEDIDYILSKVPKKRQTMLFSATILPEIRSMGERHMHRPATVSVSEDDLILPNTKQMYFAIGRKNKIWALCRVLDKEKPKAIVFAQTKHMVDIIEQRLRSYGYPAAAIHGDLTQARREKVLSDFRSGKTKVLIATDVAARGLDIEGVTHVINYDIPDSPETYVHRIGRTGRAGKEGKAITFVSADEMHLLEAVERFTDQKLKQIEVPSAKGRSTGQVRQVLDFDEMADIFGMVRFQLSLGRKVVPSIVDISDFIVRTARVNDITVGHIDIGDDHTIVEIHKDVAMKVLRALRQSKYHGRSFEVKPLPRARK